MLSKLITKTGFTAMKQSKVKYLSSLHLNAQRRFYRHGFGGLCLQPLNPRLSSLSRLYSQTNDKQPPKVDPKVLKKIAEAKKAMQSKKKGEYMDLTEEEDEEIDYAALRKSTSTVEMVITWLTLGSLIALTISYILYKLGVKDDNNPALRILYKGTKQVDRLYLSIKNIVTEPALQKLLPDQPKDREFIKTFVINLVGTLVSTEYKAGVGHLLIKRPGASYLIQRLSQMGEVVIFGNEDLMFVQDATMSFDPKRVMIMTAFGSESQVLTKKGHIKDLSYLNRNLDTVVMIDFNPEKLARQPDNLIVLPEFKGDTHDRELYDLVPFLEKLALPSIIDVRKEIKKYGGQQGYKKYLKELLEAKERLTEQQNKGIGGVFNAIERINKPKS